MMGIVARNKRKAWIQHQHNNQILIYSAN
jgi:hypothetical protein